MKLLQEWKVTVQKGKITQETALRKKKIPDSVVDELAITSKDLMKDALAKKDGMMTVIIWKDFDPEVEKKRLEKEAARVAAELEALKKEEPKKESNDKKGGDESTLTPDKELLDLQVEYEEVFGKKPHHMKKAEKLREEIKQKK